MEQIPKLFCFPYAGASASIYHMWSNRGLQAEVMPVELAGRGRRMGEDFYKQMDDAVNDAYESMVPLLTDSMPYAVFGHSMGGILAYELIHKLREEGQPLPGTLIISAAPPPHLLTKSREPVSGLSNDLLLQHLKRRGEISRFIDLETFIQVFLPIIRADYRLLETYRPILDRIAIDVDLSVFYGTEDSIGGDLMSGWERYVRGDFNAFPLRGGHFFIHERREAMIASLNRLLAGYKSSDPI
ncbi:thioesterase II family protein [Paenibacillus tarimensis]|uniref:thioesterase II family protein n=1 Tax=Paenibacillus tarimensis TaxID=416012 RepID=UPI001F2BA9A3|nr:alpha/beta fold hydrolase [Paenibacillus tarimensis]MCF2945526.1 thioesterase domain-containing protein [Paenibacillus tarimensis]